MKNFSYTTFDNNSLVFLLEKIDLPLFQPFSARSSDTILDFFYTFIERKAVDEFKRVGLGDRPKMTGKTSFKKLLRSKEI